MFPLRQDKRTLQLFAFSDLDCKIICPSSVDIFGVEQFKPPFFVARRLFWWLAKDRDAVISRETKNKNS